jgi:hypothetical protein
MTPAVYLQMKAQVLAQADAISLSTGTASANTEEAHSNRMQVITMYISIPNNDTSLCIH